MKNIVLLGPKYSGSSSIGKALAKINNLTFIDLDMEVEKQVQKATSVPIGVGKKCAEFKQLEFDLLKYYIDQENVVLSCGDGVGVNEVSGGEERDLLNKSDSSLKILLEVDEKTLTNRQQVSHCGMSNKPETIKPYKEKKSPYDAINYDLKIDSSSDNISRAIENYNLCGVIGYPIWHSLSPMIHNSCYQDLKIDDKFVYTKIEIKPEKFYKIQNIISIFRLKGMSITSPYKQEMLKNIDEIDLLSSKIGATNTVVNENGRLLAYNTDYIGVKKALEEVCNLRDKRVAVFGSGGGAKSAVIGVAHATKNITMFNRTKEKNDIFAKENGIENLSLDNFDSKKFDIIINATTVGLNSDESILSEKQVLANHIIFDMIYSPLETRLLKIAKHNGAKIVLGTQMLMYQAVEQFKLYTNLEPNLEIIKKAIYGK